VSESALWAGARQRPPKAAGGLFYWGTHLGSAAAVADSAKISKVSP
jgi:hypothetical protein